MAANNYAHVSASLERDEEAKSLLRKMVPVARRVLGECHEFVTQDEDGFTREHSTETPAPRSTISARP